MPQLPAHTVEKHTEFLFPDGNIVLATGGDPTLAFRLHKGIMSRWSPVFRRILDTLETLSDPFTFLSYDVLMFDDDPVDFERLIRVLCDGTYVFVVPLSQKNVPFSLFYFSQGLRLIVHPQTSQFSLVSFSSLTNIAFRTCKTIP